MWTFRVRATGSPGSGPGLPEGGVVKLKEGQRIRHEGRTAKVTKIRAGMVCLCYEGAKHTRSWYHLVDLEWAMGRGEPASL